MCIHNLNNGENLSGPAYKCMWVSEQRLSIVILERPITDIYLH